VAVLVGDDPASAIYVRTKTRKCEELGIGSEAFVLPATTPTEELLGRVGALNADDAVDGILVQLPLPDPIDTEAVLDRIDPRKDVDGLHPENVGRLVQGRPRFVPATPGGIMRMLDHYGIEIQGANAVIIGRSEIVGKPMASLLMHRHATITVCHSRTRDLPGVCRGADILVVAIGRAAMVTRDFVKPGAAVIDVGINRVSDRAHAEQILGAGADWAKFDERGYVVVGDVHPEVEEVAGALTPVPGGVGPLTIGMLMSNTLEAARLRAAARG
jgi:methylenetetrahydrofolate dehydrogenase (NADP+)/methenyltetrahydrofolate cyclohydrolase